jgi:hypothetical protein
VCPHHLTRLHWQCLLLGFAEALQKGMLLKSCCALENCISCSEDVSCKWSRSMQCQLIRKGHSPALFVCLWSWGLNSGFHT